MTHDTMPKAYGVPLSDVSVAAFVAGVLLADMNACSNSFGKRRPRTVTRHLR
jgi:hypothetical protein